MWVPASGPVLVAATATIAASRAPAAGGRASSDLALLEKMAIAQWKLVRMERREAIICNALPATEQNAKIEPLTRFEERLERAFFRALRELEEAAENPPPSGRRAARQGSPLSPAPSQPIPHGIKPASRAFPSSGRA
jgi:hypothetical protein